MPQPGQDLHLVAEALKENDVGLRLGHHHLDGDGPFHVDVLGLVDGPHAAGAEPVHDAIIAQDETERLAREDTPDLVIVEQTERNHHVDDDGSVRIAQAGTFR